MSANLPTSPIGETNSPAPVVGRTNGAEGSVDTAPVNPNSVDALLRQSRMPSARVSSLLVMVVVVSGDLSQSNVSRHFYPYTWQVQLAPSEK